MNLKASTSRIGWHVHASYFTLVIGIVAFTVWFAAVEDRPESLFYVNERWVSLWFEFHLLALERIFNNLIG